MTYLPSYFLIHHSYRTSFPSSQFPTHPKKNKVSSEQEQRRELRLPTNFEKEPFSHKLKDFEKRPLHRRSYDIFHQRLSSKQPLGHQRLSRTIMTIPPHNFTPLSEEVVNGIEKFVYFIGYGRSGHSLVGSMLDAHPNAIIAHEYWVFRQWSTDHKHRLCNKSVLFNDLAKNSHESISGVHWRNPRLQKKGYSLYVDGLWQGTFKDKLKVIGDKSGDDAPWTYQKSPPNTTRYCRELQDLLGIPFRAIYVARNPYDVMATIALYRSSPIPEVKVKASKTEKFNNTARMEEAFNVLFGKVKGMVGMVRDCNQTILEIHIADMIRNPQDSIQRICDYLDLECHDDYLQKCVKKMYTTVSKTRDVVVWPPELLMKIQEEKKKYRFF